MNGLSKLRVKLKLSPASFVRTRINSPGKMENFYIYFRNYKHQSIPKLQAS
jgi:hypothetical protein